MTTSAILTKLGKVAISHPSYNTLLAGCVTAAPLVTTPPGRVCNCSLKIPTAEAAVYNMEPVRGAASPHYARWHLFAM